MIWISLTTFFSMIKASTTPIIAAGEEAPWQDDVPELQQPLR
jgi:hypothetical protein